MLSHKRKLSEELALPSGVKSVERARFASMVGVPRSTGSRVKINSIQFKVAKCPPGCRMCVQRRIKVPTESHTATRDLTEAAV